ncbi:MAG TPA: hypothetical protein VNL18_13010 [Gemmatimonadales bacterium]|nr:hypothetical protein [Gemmatimonadales bacterium]
MKSTVRVSALIAALVFAGCREDVPTSPASPQFEIRDGAHSGGNGGFYFLPPLVGAPTYAGTFDAAQSPEVQICEWQGDGCADVVARYTMASGSGSELLRVSEADEHYSVNWHTDQFDLDPEATYRIRVLVAGTVLGFADVDVVTSGKELRNVNTGQYIGLVDGRTLPIKFRIEVGAVTILGPDGGTVESTDGNATVVVPAGLVDGPLGFTVHRAPVPTEQIAEAGLVGGTAYEFGPSGTVFADPGVTVTLRYDPAALGGFDPSELTLLTEIDGRWAEIPYPQVDAASHTVSASVGHFSVIVLGKSQLATINEPYLTFVPGEGPKTLTYTIGEFTRFIGWSTSNAAVALVAASTDGQSNGIVTQVAPGAAQIRVSSYDPYYGGWKDSKWVTVLASVPGANQLAWFKQREGVTSADLFGVGGTGPTDVYAVGRGGTVIHYDGVTATQMTTPTTCTYRGVWARAANDVYVVGRCAAGFGSRLLRYNGSSWSVVAAPPDAGFWNLHGNADYVFIAAGDRFYRWAPTTGLELAATFSPSVVLRAVAAEGSDVVAVGQDGTNGVMFLSSDNGQTWTTGSTPVDYWGRPASGPLTAVWRDPGLPLIAASTLDGRVVMYREDWGMWAINEQLTNVVFEAITSNPQVSPYFKPDVFLGGDNGELDWAERCRCGFGAPGFRFEQSVHQHILGLWTEGPTGRIWGVGTAGLVFRQTGYRRHTFDVLARGQPYADVWVHSSGRVIAGAVAPNSEVWMTSSFGADWFGASLQRGGAGFQGAWGAADGSEAYVVGLNGAIARGTPSSSGFAFTNLTSGTTQELLDVWVNSTGSVRAVYAVGRSGTVLRSTNHGASWVSRSSAVFGGQHISQVYGLSDDYVVVTAADGSIYRTADGGLSWTRIRTGGGEFFSGLWMSSPSEIYVSGQGPNGGGVQGVSFHTHDGGTAWIPAYFPANRYLGGTWGDGSGAVYIAGSGGTVLLVPAHLGGPEPAPATWARQPTGTVKDLFAVHGAGNVVFAVGAAGTIVTGLRP